MAELPIAQFLRERLTEYDSSFELRSGTGFEALFFKPLQFIVQPLRDEANDLFVAQSFRRILQQDDPDAFDEDSVDSLASNIFVDRREGGFSSGTAKAFYNDPVDREYPANGAIFTGSNGKTYSNPSPFLIRASEMSSQVQDGLFFFSIPVRSDEPGSDTELEVGGIISLEGDNDVVIVTNEVAVKGGITRETNTEYIERTKNSIGVRDLVTGKGFNAILFENFPDILREIQPVGFGDQEMMRDVLFNTHVGGRVDGYFNTPSIVQGSKDFVGLLLDITRQTFTSANVPLTGTTAVNVGNPNIDRSNNRAPVVTEIKLSSSAEYLSTQDLSSPSDFSVNQHIKLVIDGTALNVRVAGVNPAATTRNEIVNLINGAFGINVAFASGDTFKVRSPSLGLLSSVTIDNPDVGNSVIDVVFGLAIGTAPHDFVGDGPVTFLEGINYSIDDGLGTIQRILGANIVTPQTTGETVATSDIFADPTSNIFLSVQARDIITLTNGVEPADYRVLEKVNNNQLRVDHEFTTTEGTLEYSIARTGIKDLEVVFIQYYFNPLSIDVQKLGIINEVTSERGIRPGRELQTIADLAFLRITSIDLIDALTGESTGQVLDGSGGYGQGGYGIGQYGIGDGSEYRLIVEKPAERFSEFEEAYIKIDTAFQGLSFRVNYDYVPEVTQLHDFVRSENERVLDGDILMKYFIPAFTSGSIRYRVDETDSTVPTNDALQLEVRDFVNNIRGGGDVEYSDIVQFILRKIDPFDRFTSFIEPFTLNATIHNTDGTKVKITGTDKLQIPTLDPFPKQTNRPLSPKIARWIAETDLTLVRINDEG